MKSLTKEIVEQHFNELTQKYLITTGITYVIDQMTIYKYGEEQFETISIENITNLLKLAKMFKHINDYLTSVTNNYTKVINITDLLDSCIVYMKDSHLDIFWYEADNYYSALECVREDYNSIVNYIVLSEDNYNGINKILDMREDDYIIRE